MYSFSQLSGHDHTILTNEYQPNYDVIISKYVTKYWQEISNKSDANNKKGYQVSKIIIAFYSCKLWANSPTMITQFLQMIISEIMMFLC